MQCSSTDIGGCGCYVETMVPLHINAEVTITFWVDSEKIQTTGVVRASDPGVGMGIEFTALEGHIQKRLHLLLLSRGRQQNDEIKDSENGDKRDHLNVRVTRVGRLPRDERIHVDDLARLLLALAGAAPSNILIEADDGKAGGWSHREFARARRCATATAGGGASGGPGGARRPARARARRPPASGTCRRGRGRGAAGRGRRLTRNRC